MTVTQAITYLLVSFATGYGAGLLMLAWVKFMEGVSS